MLRISLLQLIVATILGSPINLFIAQVAQAQDYYGAIAYSEAAGSHGYSYDYSTRSAAETRALRECESFSGFGDCQVLVWFRNACGALAKAPNGGYGSGWGDNRAIAERYALETCNQYERNCQVIRWVCTKQ